MGLVLLLIIYMHLISSDCRPTDYNDDDWKIHDSVLDTIVESNENALQADDYYSWDEIEVPDNTGGCSAGYKIESGFEDKYKTVLVEELKKIVNQNLKETEAEFSHHDYKGKLHVTPDSVHKIEIDFSDSKKGASEVTYSYKITDLTIRYKEHVEFDTLGKIDGKFYIKLKNQTVNVKFNPSESEKGCYQEAGSDFKMNREVYKTFFPEGESHKNVSEKVLKWAPQVINAVVYKGVLEEIDREISSRLNAISSDHDEVAEDYSVLSHDEQQEDMPIMDEKVSVVTISPIKGLPKGGCKRGYKLNDEFQAAYTPRLKDAFKVGMNLIFHSSTNFKTEYDFGPFHMTPKPVEKLELVLVKTKIKGNVMVNTYNMTDLVLVYSFHAKFNDMKSNMTGVFKVDLKSQTFDSVFVPVEKGNDCYKEGGTDFELDPTRAESYYEINDPSGTIKVEAAELGKKIISGMVERGLFDALNNQLKGILDNKVFDTTLEKNKKKN